MSADLIDVMVIGHPDPRWSDGLRAAGLPAAAASGFAVRQLDDDRDLDVELARRIPHAIVTFGEVSNLPRLLDQPIEIRRRWTHVDDPDTPAESVAHALLQVFLDVALDQRFPDEPLVSVFTPAYRTGALIHRTYWSIVAQTYGNWEWVVHDDSPDDETYDIVRALARNDHRIRLFRADRPSGVIGEVKRRCCGYARGQVLVELDHDDELTPNCLTDVVQAFRLHPDAGFAYTDGAVVFDDGVDASYGETFAFGFGSHRRESLGGRDYLVMNSPSINAMTVRHIVGMPNHVRAWTRSAYEATGGFAPEIHVADDYELCLRTFLTTPMVHIRRFGYVQYLQRAGGNTQQVRNAEIQRLVALFADRYGERIHRRFEELGVDDFIWNGTGVDWNLPRPDPVPIANRVVV